MAADGVPVGAGTAHGMVAGAVGTLAGVVGMVAVGEAGTIRGTPVGMVPAGADGTAVALLLAAGQTMVQELRIMIPIIGQISIARDRLRQATEALMVFAAIQV